MNGYKQGLWQEIHEPETVRDFQGRIGHETGNGKVDLHLRCGDKQGIIEVKSFKDASDAKRARCQAAGYAKSLRLNNVTLVLFVPVDDDVLEKLSGEHQI